MTMVRETRKAGTCSVASMFFATEAIMPLYRNAIRSCGKAGKWQRAVSLLRQLSEDDLAPDSYCYAQAMSACRRAGQWPLTLRLLADLGGSGAAADPFTTSPS